MKLTFLFLLFPFSIFGAVNLSPNAPDTLNTIIQTHNELIERKFKGKGPSKWHLDRLDLEVGLNAGGELGILGISAESAVELIWEREEIKNQKFFLQPVDVTLNISTDSPEIIFSDLKSQILSFLNDRSLSSRTKRKILKELKKDSEKIGLFVRELQTMPRVGDWYIDGFVKTYFFNVRGNILPSVQLGYDKRVRFRFTFTDIPLAKTVEVNLSKIQKFHAKFMRGLNKVSLSEDPESHYRLSRVWARTEVTSQFDAIIFQVGGGNAFQTVYRKVPRSFLTPPESLIPSLSEESENFENVVSASRKLLSPLIPSQHSSFPLSQVRLKFSWELGAGFNIADINKNSVLEFHYFRGNK